LQRLEDETVKQEMKGSGKLDGVEIELYHVDEWNWKIGWS
jgi:hypothetical protein